MRGRREEGKEERRNEGRGEEREGEIEGEKEGEKGRERELGLWLSERHVYVRASLMVLEFGRV